MLATGTAAHAAPSCPPPPSPGADAATELLLMVDTGPGGAAALESVLYGWGDRWWVDAATFAAWRVTPGPARSYAGKKWHALDAVPKLAFAIDGCAQALHVDLSAVERAVVSYGDGDRAQDAVPPASPGAYVGYDAQYSSDHGHGQAATLTELGLFGPAGRGVQTQLLGTAGSVRLDSTWLVESPEGPRVLGFGDGISSAGTWGRALRFGGLRWATDYSLQPYLVTYPRPSLRGSAALPSTLDVFVNDSLSTRQDVDGGAFDLRNVPTLTGAGEAEIVMRDPLGRESRVRQPFYVSQALLRAGLHSYALDAGFERQRYALDSWDYGLPFADYTVRRGITDTWTQELRVESQHGAAAVGTSALWLPQRIGLFSATAAWGRRDGGGGALGALGFEREQAGRYGFAARSQWTTPEFWQLGQVRGKLPPRRTDFARVSASPHPRGALALAWIHEQRRDEPSLRLYSLSYTAQLLPQLQLLFSAVDARADTRSRTLLASLSWGFGDRLGGELQREWQERGENATRFALQRAAANPLDWSARVDVQEGVQPREELRGGIGTEAALFSGDAVIDSRGLSARVGASGAALFLDHRGYLSRPLQGSFAVVKVADAADVSIYADQRLVGRTGPSGTALVPDLRPYEVNTLSLHADDVPLDLPLASMKRQVTPRARSGVLVNFADELAIGAQVEIVDEQGRKVPGGASVRDIATAQEFPVDNSGHVYMVLPQGEHHLWVTAQGWDCTARVELRRDASPPVATCRAGQ